MANISLKSLLKEGADTPYDWKHDKNARWRTNDKNKYVNTNRQRQNSAKNAKNVDKIIDISDRLEKDGYRVEPWGMESDGRMGLDFYKDLPGGGNIWFGLAPDENGKITMPLVSTGQSVKKAGGIRGWFGGKDEDSLWQKAPEQLIDADNLSSEDFQKAVEDNLRKGIADMQSQWSKVEGLNSNIINSLHKEAETSMKRTSSIPKSKSDSNTPTDDKGSAGSKEQPKAEPKKQAQQAPSKQTGNVDLNKKIKNPETDNDISLKSALGYDKNSAVYKAATQQIQKDKGDSSAPKKDEPVKGASMFGKDYKNKK